MAELVPIYLEEIVPGDRFRVNSEILARFAPMISPIMHRVNVKVDYFFVPNRIVWNDWKDFITGGEDGAQNPSFPEIMVNTTHADKYAKGTLSDYMGFPPPPTTIGQWYGFNALPFRGYQEIYNEWYRDQNLQPKVEFSKDGSLEADIGPLTTLRTRAWEKDYFTSALPWAQKGGAVSVPIDLSYKEPAEFRTTPGGTLTDAGNIESISDGRASHDTQGMVTIENIDGDLTGINVEDLRTSTRLQQWLERNARSGSRYVESILAHFGERVPDYTAQRPVYLGGGQQPVTISEVLQTSQTDTTGDISPQGNMAGHGISAGSPNMFKGTFKEHGFVFGIMSVLPRTAYSQGFEKFWFKKDKFEYYWNEFAQLGEQPIMAGELYYDWAAASSSGQWNKTFGYQARYDDYRKRRSRIAGDMRDTLAFWHLGRYFDTEPQLNDSFIKADPRKDIFAVTDNTDHLWIQVFNNVQAMRRIPKYNIPTL